jgi:ribosomal protein S18 acetylase RimI-like enzyme
VQDNEESSPASIAILAVIIMDQQSVTLRASNPTFDEGLVFARYLDEAADGFFRFMLGRRAAHIIGKAYTQPDHNYSFQNVIFAERDKLILGMVSGFTAEQHCCFSDQPLKEAAGYRALRMMAVKTLCAPLLRILSTLADGDFYLLAIAIAKELRGEGIGSTLIDSIEDRARDAGATRLSLDVSAKNEGARRLYERRGMTVESQWPKRLVIPGLRLLRMTKTL